MVPSGFFRRARQTGQPSWELWSPPKPAVISATAMAVPPRSACPLRRNDANFPASVPAASLAPRLRGHSTKRREERGPVVPPLHVCHNGPRGSECMACACACACACVCCPTALPRDLSSPAKPAGPIFHGAGEGRGLARGCAPHSRQVVDASECQLIKAMRFSDSSDGAG